MWCKQSTALTLIVGPVLDATGAEYAGAVIGDLSISKNGGSLTALASAATLTYIANGQYTLVLTTTNTDTLGALQVLCNKAGYQMPTAERQVIPATVYDAFTTNATTAAGGLGDVQRVAGTAQTARDLGNALPAAVPGANGGLPTVDANNNVHGLQVGTGTGQLNASGGKVPATLAAADVSGNIPASAGGTAFVHTAGRLWVLDGSGNAVAPASDSAAIKARTDNLPPDPTSAATVAAAFATLTSHGDSAWVTATGFAVPGDAMALTGGERDAVAAALLDLANGVESGKTLRQALRLMAAALCGKRSNAGTTSEAYDAIGNPGTARVVANADGSGNGTPTLTP